MTDTFDKIIDIQDCLPGKTTMSTIVDAASNKTAITTVCGGDVCLIARDEGLIIKSESAIPWRSATAVAEEIMRMVGEWV